MKVIAMSALALVLASATAMAHPHVFLESRIELSMDDHSLNHVLVEWRFDAGFTAMVRLDFDADRDGRLDPTEVAAVEDGAFRNLRNYDYFTRVRLDGREVAIRDATDFRASLEDGALVYRFRLPVAARFSREAAVAQFDDTYYTAIALTPDAGVSGAPDAAVELRRDSRTAIRYAPADSGSATTYPDEVVVRR